MLIRLRGALKGDAGVFPVRIDFIKIGHIDDARVIIIQHESFRSKILIIRSMLSKLFRLE